MLYGLSIDYKAESVFPLTSKGGLLKGLDFDEGYSITQAAAAEDDYKKLLTRVIVFADCSLCSVLIEFEDKLLIYF